jgi:hypothetical protein
VSLLNLCNRELHEGCHGKLTEVWMSFTDAYRWHAVIAALALAAGCAVSPAAESSNDLVGVVAEDVECFSPVWNDAIAAGFAQLDNQPYTPDPRCAVDGHYCYGFNNCHHHANCFANQVPVARVVLCSDTGGGGYGDHSIDLIPRPGSDDSSDDWCLVEPQNGQTCCWSQPPSMPDACPNVLDVDVSSGAAADCMAQLCGKPYDPRTCRVLSPGERAKVIQDALDQCRANNPSDGAACRACCDAEGDQLRHDIQGWCSGPNDPYDDLAHLDGAVARCKGLCPLVVAPTPVSIPILDIVVSGT